MADNPATHPVRTRILDLCLHAFNQEGYKSVSMDLVSRQLKISKKTIYRHFSSKEEILEEVLKDRLKGIEDKVEQAMDGSGSDLKDLNTLANLYFEFLESLSGSLLKEIRESLPHLSTWIDLTEKTAFFDRFRKLLRSLRNEGHVFYSLNTKELTDSILSLLRGIADLPAEKRNTLLGLVIKGLAKGATGRKKGGKPEEEAKPEKVEKKKAPKKKKPKA